jgi:hypothetical protein
VPSLFTGRFGGARAPLAPLLSVGAVAAPELAVHLEERLAVDHHVDSGEPAERNESQGAEAFRRVDFQSRCLGLLPLPALLHAKEEREKLFKLGVHPFRIKLVGAHQFVANRAGEAEELRSVSRDPSEVRGEERTGGGDVLLLLIFRRLAFARWSLALFRLALVFCFGLGARRLTRERKLVPVPVVVPVVVVGFFSAIGFLRLKAVCVVGRKPRQLLVQKLLDGVGGGERREARALDGGDGSTPSEPHFLLAQSGGRRRGSALELAVDPAPDDRLDVPAVTAEQVGRDVVFHVGQVSPGPELSDLVAGAPDVPVVVGSVRVAASRVLVVLFEGKPVLFGDAPELGFFGSHVVDASDDVEGSLEFGLGDLNWDPLAGLVEDPETDDSRGSDGGAAEGFDGPARELEEGVAPAHFAKRDADGSEAGGFVALGSFGEGALLFGERKWWGFWF